MCQSIRSPDDSYTPAFLIHTSNDCEYQSWTFLMDGISFSPSGKSPSSWTRCAKRMGSSSERNWEARKRVPAGQGI